MPKLHDEWTLLPHGPLRELAPGLLTVVGQIPMPLGNFPRRMTVVGLERKRTAIYSPIALGDEQMERIEALGEPAFLIIPNGAHRLDLRPFHKRYPKAKIVTASRTKTAIAEAAEPVETKAALGKSAELITVAGTQEREIAMLVRHADGCSLVTNDLIGNVGHPKGAGAWVMSRLMGFGPKPRIPKGARKFFITDPKALAEQLRQWAAIEGLRRIVPSHGDVIDNPAPVLRALASALDK